MFQDKGYHFINSHISVKKLIGLVKTQIFQDYSFFLQKYKYFDIPKSPYFHCEKLNDGRNRNEVLISKEFFFKIKENPIYMPEISFLEDVFIESERIFNKYIKLISNNSLLLILNYTTIVIKLIEYKFDNKLFFNHPHFDKTLFSVVWGSNILHENFLIAPYSLKFEDRLEIKDLNHVKEDSFPIIIPGVG